MTIKSILRRSFVNPFSIILFILAAVSFVTDGILSSNFSRNTSTFVILLSIILISGVIRFFQELKSKKIADYLDDLVETEVNVFRDEKLISISGDEVKNGDEILLEAGMQLNFDVKLSSVNDFFISESAITGESEIFEQKENEICRSGSVVIGGKARGIVVSLKNNFKNTKNDFGISEKREHAFDKGAASISKVLIRFIAILVPSVFVICIFTKGDILKSFLFSLSVAVGLIPEMLPMVVNACLAHSSSVMGKKQTIVKNINAMQSFASLDVLCVDKTGTLTGDKIILEYYMDIFENESQKVLEYAFINSLFHSGIKNHLDSAILEIKKWNEEKFSSLEKSCKKIDTLPFDYSRKIATVLVEKNEKKLLLSKGSVEEIIRHCKSFEYKGEIFSLTEDKLVNLKETVCELESDGMKVMAVAYKNVENEKSITNFSENDLIFLGYLVFFDSPKKSAFSAIQKLKEKNISVRVLSGDKKEITLSICRRLNLNTKSIITGKELESVSDDKLPIIIEETEIFSELSPLQKSKIVKILQQNGHTVGFLGDGMNDLPAVVTSDAGISVENSVSALKECSNVILLKKDLNILEEGIKQGRKAFLNMTKYIKITASSNFGNIFSIVLASVFLPFFPMSALQLLLLNLLYDTLCLSLPWDNVDEDECVKPLEWSGKNLGKFMRFFGPVSSIFDIITFAFLYFFLCPSVCGGNFTELSLQNQSHFISLFQTGWFLESLWSQVLILHLLRTKKMIFIQSKPSFLFQAVTVFGILLFTIIACSPLGGFASLSPLPPIYFAFLFFVVICYFSVMTIAKKIYIRKNKTLY